MEGDRGANSLPSSRKSDGLAATLSIPVQTNDAAASVVDLTSHDVVSLKIGTFLAFCHLPRTGIDWSVVFVKYRNDVKTRIAFRGFTNQSRIDQFRG